MDYRLSKHNIISQIKNSDEYFIINPLSRNADILDAETAGAIMDGSPPNKEELIEKGYLSIPEEEEKLFRSGYLDFLDSRDEDEVQIFYVPTYTCNFNCTYCYQEGYENEKPSDYKPVIKAFFEYVDSEFAGRRKYITVFGGEPLLPDPTTRAKIELIIEEANKRGLSLAFVTNGYSLESYIPMLKTASVRELQITIDGPADIHNQRRPLHSGKGTFSEVAAGVDAALEAGLPVNLRAVMDKENMPHLPALAELAVERGWTASKLFKTQLGRNYELHYCQENSNKLYDRLSMYEDLYDLIKKHPVVMEFHRPAYSISRFLFDNGEMPEPLYDSCPGCKTEWAFDYSGQIFSCTATVGKPGESLGTFYPEKTLKEDAAAAWQDRDVTSIPECRNCELRLACGGGCASAAKNRNGEINSPDCRPVAGLMSLGLSLYFKEN
ncbi:MAG: radical SAM protein [Spirochaetales bacterium]|uniref:Radical SAM protein n=1 Tax=Candidatus Thalassospirochaeta sargassi TaxID=3119039 RepID=A0AAJ1IBP3_9SPIO|nr:radical SAM protein [Spirochaetales bacterium]